MLKISRRSRVFLTAAVAGLFFVSSSCAMTAERNGSVDVAVNASAVKQSSSLEKSEGSRTLSTSQNLYFKRNWGIEVIGVHPVSSGYMLNFRYRIVDPVKAKSLNDMKSKAYVIDDVTGTRLAVPAMEKVGELRSGNTPQADRIYFMIFGNPGKLVKPGGKVSVVVGNFRVDGLVVN